MEEDEEDEEFEQDPDELKKIEKDDLKYDNEVDDEEEEEAEQDGVEAVADGKDVDMV